LHSAQTSVGTYPKDNAHVNMIKKINHMRALVYMHNNFQTRAGKVAVQAIVYAKLLDIFV